MHGPTPKEERCRRMIGLAREFEPTMILHHPHTTYSPRVWAGAWGAMPKHIARSPTSRQTAEAVPPWRAGSESAQPRAPSSQTQVSQPRSGASAPRSSDGDDGEPDRRPRCLTAPLRPTSLQVSTYPRWTLTTRPPPSAHPPRSRTNATDGLRRMPTGLQSSGGGSADVEGDGIGGLLSVPTILHESSTFLVLTWSYGENIGDLPKHYEGASFTYEEGAGT